MSRKHVPKGTFQNRLLQVRKESGLSRAKAAELVGFHWVTIYRHEAGVIRITKSAAERYAKAYGVSNSELFFDPKESMTETQ